MTYYGLSAHGTNVTNKDRPDPHAKADPEKSIQKPLFGKVTLLINDLCYF